VKSNSMCNQISLPFGTFEYHDSFIHVFTRYCVQTPGRVQKICVSDKAVIT
jgi:hypothetical protein